MILNINISFARIHSLAILVEFWYNLVEEQHEIDAESEDQSHIFQVVKIPCQERYHAMTIFRQIDTWS